MLLRQKALIATHGVKGEKSDYNNIKRYRVILCRLCFVIAKLGFGIHMIITSCSAFN